MCSCSILHVIITQNENYEQIESYFILKPKKVHIHKKGSSGAFIYNNTILVIIGAYIRR